MEQNVGNISKGEDRALPVPSLYPRQTSLWITARFQEAMDHRLGQAGTQVKPLCYTVCRRTTGLKIPEFTGKKAEGAG